MLLDGGYYIKEDKYKYNALKGENIDSLQKEIDYYVKDFDEYCFDTLQEHIEAEKNNYLRWSSLLEEASKDLVIIEKDKYKYHASGFAASCAIKSMFNYPPNSVYDRLPKSIYLLQSSLPKSMTEIRESLVEKFRNSTGAIVKRIEGAGHLIHWDKPYEVANEILCWFQ